MKNKRIILSVFFSIYMLGSTTAQGNNEADADLFEQEQDVQAFHGRAVTQISASELPEGVQRVIAQGEFRKWDIEEAYQIHGGSERPDGQASYIVVVNRRNDRFALYYDSEGKMIRQELMDVLETSRH